MLGNYNSKNFWTTDISSHTTYQLRRPHFPRATNMTETRVLHRASKKIQEFHMQRINYFSSYLGTASILPFLPSPPPPPQSAGRNAVMHFALKVSHGSVNRLTCYFM